MASFEASEHEAQVLDEVQRSIAGDSSYAGSIAAKMGGEPAMFLKLDPNTVCMLGSCPSVKPSKGLHTSTQLIELTELGCS